MDLVVKFPVLVDTMNTDKKIPVTVISGFLGSGKTTAIIQLLKQKSEDEQWAVLINEFGKVSVDYDTLSPKASTNERVFEISGGCICCSAKDYFRQNLDDIIQKKRFDRILIEPSGLGGADMISEIIKEKEILELMPVIGLVSIDYLENKKLQINPIYKNQLLKSDILVLSKCDLETNSTKHDEALGRLKMEYPGKLHYSKSFNGSMEMTLLMYGGPEVKGHSPFSQVIFSHPDLKDSNYESISLLFDAHIQVDVVGLFQTLKGEVNIVRAKGFLNGYGGWKFVNYTFGDSMEEACAVHEKNKLAVIFEKSRNYPVEKVMNSLAASLGIPVSDAGWNMH